MSGQGILEVDGAFRIEPFNQKGSLKHLGIDISIAPLQKLALLGSARILWKVLDRTGLRQEFDWLPLEMHCCWLISTNLWWAVVFELCEVHNNNNNKWGAAVWISGHPLPFYAYTTDFTWVMSAYSTPLQGAGSWLGCHDLQSLGVVSI